MSNLTTKSNFINFLRGQREFNHKNYRWDKHWFFVQAGTCMGDELHYEYIQNKVQLHIENVSKYCSKQELTEYLIQSIHDDDLSCKSWQNEKNCAWVLDRKIATEDDLFQAFIDIYNKIEPHILNFERKLLGEDKDIVDNDKFVLDENNPTFDDWVSHEEDVVLLDKKNIDGNEFPITLGDLMNNNLTIPDYQRIYCWEKKQVYQLWKDIKNLSDTKPYHMGNIILHYKDGKYAIVDGQQRLVTLTLFLRELNEDISKLPLLYEKFDSRRAQDYIALNRSYIQGYCFNQSDKDGLRNRMKNNLIFSVLILNSEKLDLAYTFFSNQNSKGVALSDYNLLKAHHLRYVSIEEQAKHLAHRWDKLIVEDLFYNGNKQTTISVVLGMYLYRLRKWMRKHEWIESAKYRVRDEFAAADTLLEIPPFGEQFIFYEKIQGGTHFFVYSETFVNKFKEFIATIEYQTLSQYLSYESHWRYKDVIACLLFGYYLKFGNQYLAEALYCITERISLHRYENQRALLPKILKYASDSEVIMVIDQATSPTFVFAELLETTKQNTQYTSYQGIRKRYHDNITSMYDYLVKKGIFTDETILSLLQK